MIVIDYIIAVLNLDPEQLLEQEHPGWISRAEARTASFSTLGHYEESSSIWSEVKVVFMRLQHGKCGYCERQLESEEHGRIEHDLEHFRPKKKSKPWKLPRELSQAGVTLTAPLAGSSDPGYHLLVYNPLNYCTSCKTCNSSLKGNNFPIGAVRNTSGSDPIPLHSEQPLLLNPVGDFDADPEDLISFYGLSPTASSSSGYDRQRALVIIVFFRLDDVSRKYLFRERANIITSLFSYLDLFENANTLGERLVWRQLIDIATSPGSSHTNCARSFLRLYERNRNEAAELFQLAVNYLATISN